MTINVLLIPVFVIGCIPTKAQQCPSVGVFLPNMPSCTNGDYYLSFEDNFDGNALDLSKWEIQPWGQGGFGSNQEFNTLENVEVSNGTCKIIAKRENLIKRAINYLSDEHILSDGQPNLREFNFTSANLWTKRSDFNFGKYEIRCRIPAGQGFWPAFWTYGGVHWNEIDVFEIYGDDVDKFTCNAHYDMDGDMNSENCGFSLNNAADFTQWHVFTCLYEFDKIIWQIDGLTVRVFHRYSTVTGSSISCNDNIASGTYFSELSYPVENMHIIFNLAIQSGTNAPTSNTIFPSTFEVDYVRFYIKSEEPPCDGCFTSIYYEETEQLPSNTRASTLIEAGTGVSVQSGQNVQFNAPNIQLINGFSVENNASFTANSVECNLLTFEEFEPLYLGNNAFNETLIDKCVNPEFMIHAVGAQYYTFQTYSTTGQLEYSTMGFPISNHIEAWNANTTSAGIYNATLALFNCNVMEYFNFQLIVSDGNCKNHPKTMLDALENQSQQKPTTLSGVFVYPNPTQDDLFVSSSVEIGTIISIEIHDIGGRLVFMSNQAISSINSPIRLNLNFLDSGVYLIRAVQNNIVDENLFVIAK